MPSTRTPGIRIDRTGSLIIDKEHRGIPIYVRLGATDQQRAEGRLAEEVRCVDEMPALRAGGARLSRTARDATSVRSRGNDPQR